MELTGAILTLLSELAGLIVVRNQDFGERTSINLIISYFLGR